MASGLAWRDEYFYSGNREKINSALFADDFPVLNDIEKDAVDRILAIIRTEKLKLLAEVRERVVGEHKPKTRGLTQNPNNAAYWTKASQAEFDLIEQQLNNLAKLEAEL